MDSLKFQQLIAILGELNAAQAGRPGPCVNLGNWRGMQCTCAANPRSQIASLPLGNERGPRRRPDATEPSIAALHPVAPIEYRRHAALASYRKVLTALLNCPACFKRLSAALRTCEAAASVSFAP